ncbi:hypothetical protein [Streptomyces sp. NPDC023588]|uniref:hypothetical protein n=1 Tax=Streptomyces sp. NPDC023588 TaxID=3154907 RepID=UPI0034087B36
MHVALDDPQTARLFGKRPGVTREVVQDQMSTGAYVDWTANQCATWARTGFDEACEAFEEIQEKQRIAASATNWYSWVACLLVLLGTVVAFATGGPLALACTVLSAAGAAFVLSWRGTTVWFNLRQCLAVVGWSFAWIFQRFRLGIMALSWADTLLVQGTTPVVAQLVRHMLGDDPDSLFIPDGYEGLRAPRASGYLVTNGASRQLQRKLDQIKYGTIAVCGPRGSGKTTLLERSVEQAHFGLLSQAPAAYTPHDFLLSLSVRMCETYVRKEGYTVPEFTLLSPFHRLLRSAKLRAKRMGRWSAFAVPSAALIVLGLSASARSLYAMYADTVADFARIQAEDILDQSREIWQGHSVATSMVVTVVGISWWRSRHEAWIAHLVGRAWSAGSLFFGIGLAVVCTSTLFFDKDIQQQVRHLQVDTVGYFILLGGSWMVCRFFAASGIEFPVGKWHISLEGIFRPLAAAAGIAVLLFFGRNPQARALLADAENPLRLAAVVVGILWARAGGWRPRPAEPELVTRCRNHLYRLQTVQTSAHALTTGASQILSVGSSHTSSVSTIPPNFPALVEDFRDLLTRIAAEKAEKGQRVVIAIDEVDRLGSDTKALAFLSEIKAILGVPHVYYLISVAEDVGAAFVRRGLPHRDVTDSSLDDIVHLQPSTLEESRAILAKRSETLTSPYAMLAHALSGGVLRDLLRYGLQIKEMQDKTQSSELTDLSRHLILEELSETLAGFRTLLGKHQWTPDTGDMLSDFRTLGGYLRDSCTCREAELRHALEQFAFHGIAARNPLVDREVATDARQLIDEASAYAYFSLTLLDIFSTEGFERRTQQAADNGQDGDPQRLAEARQELGMSPYSVRPLMNDIRKAWSLPLGPTASTDMPSPRRGDCPAHPSGS